MDFDTVNRKKFLYSEMFSSIQGEGYYTGVPSVWLRYFLCNLQCNGFGQINPTDPDTYKLPYQDIDPSQYGSMEELPVFTKGCDSSYSWSKKFKSLQHQGTPEEIANRLEDLLTNGYNIHGSFRHPNSNQGTHLVFTGGEPMMRHAQLCTVAVLECLRTYSNQPSHITFETNGTQPIISEFMEYFSNKGMYSGELFFSVSPKLWTTAGEKREKAIDPKVVRSYEVLGGVGQLKFVVNGTERTWDEVAEVVQLYRDAGVTFPVWIMPVGATVEGQQGEISGHKSAGDIANEAIERGYNVSARVHTYLWGNKIGT